MRDYTGTRLGGRYALSRKIGEGGMGTVYEAVDETSGRVVAVKVVGLVTDEALLRFRREARAAGALHHPNIATLLDFRIGADEPPFLVMDIVPGRSLRDVLRLEKTLEPERVARIAIQALSALATAHAARVIHRDIKPGNLLLTTDDDRDETPRSSLRPRGGWDEHVTLVDFGAAKILSGSQAAITTAGTFIGTLSYISPEQLLTLELDGRADVYSLALCMYVSLVGRNPYITSSPDDTVRAILAGKRPSLQDACRDLDADFADIVERGLATDRRDRFASAEEMAIALRVWLGEDGESTSVAPISIAAPSESSRPRAARAAGESPRGRDAGAADERDRPSVRLLAAVTAVAAAGVITGAAAASRLVGAPAAASAPPARESTRLLPTVDSDGGTGDASSF